jgi:hypothetical protein
MSIGRCTCSNPTERARADLASDAGRGRGSTLRGAPLPLLRPRTGRRRRLRSIASSELPQYRLDVHLDGCLCDFEVPCDLLVGFSALHQRQDRRLTGDRPLIRVSHWFDSIEGRGCLSRTPRPNLPLGTIVMSSAARAMILTNSLDAIELGTKADAPGLRDGVPSHATDAVPSATISNRCRERRCRTHPE